MGILIKNNIVNQKGNPAWYESSLETRPIANIQGRMFVDTDTPSTGIYRDNGATWDQVADPGAGTTGTLQQVTTNGSSTNVGISVSANGIGIGTALPGSNRLDIHTATGINATFNGTGTTNSALQLQSAGVGKWNISNKYNSAANDFVLTDVLNSVDRLTIANTGTATYNGFIVVNNASTAQNIQILGTAPAYTMGITSGGNYGASVGMASVANNFIQGSAIGDMCIVNQSVGGKNLKIGVLSANAAAINISPNNRVGIGTSTDAGYLLDVNGFSKIAAGLTIGQTSYLAGTYSLDTTTGGIAGIADVARFATNGNGGTGRGASIVIGSGGSSNTVSVARLVGYQETASATANNASFSIEVANSSGTLTEYLRVNNAGGVGIGTNINAGYKLDVNGTARLGSSTNSVKFSSDANANYINQTIGSYGCYYQLASNTYPTNDKSCITIQASGSTKGIRFDGPGGYANMFINLAASSSADMYVNIGADATGQINACSILELTSTVKGFLPPKLTTAQKTAIGSPVSGLLVYDTTLNKLAVYTGAAWETVTSV